MDGDILYTRVYASIYPKINFVEDARPDYFIKREDFDSILKEVYGTTGDSIYKAYSSGKCLDIRLINKYKTMFVVTYLMERDITDCTHRITSKDLDIVIELGDMDYLQTKLDKLTAKAYNALEMASFVDDSELKQALLHVFFYPNSDSERAKLFCLKHDKLKYDRIKNRDTGTSKTKIGFAIP